MTDRVDVLVVGGGLAGLRAALSAHEAGARVVIAAKGKIGRSGSSAITSWGYAAVLPGEGRDSFDAHFADTMRGGAGLPAAPLVRILVEEAPLRLAEVEAMGGAFEKSGEGRWLAPTGDHSIARTAVGVSKMGIDYTIPLAERAREAGVTFIENAIAYALLRSAEGVAGAVFLETETGQLRRVEAGATILATGGAARLFPISSNPRDVTGDGYALAARAGVALRDMEFIQFYPWRCIDPFDNSRVAIQQSTFSRGGRLFNRRGERFMFEYDRVRGEATSRDIAARGIADQIRRGLDVRGGARLDISEMPDGAFRQANSIVVRGCEARGIDWRTHEFIVAPEAHFFMGGCVIDEHGATDLPGLFAAGEVAGGVHGANRLGNNALPECLVFGHRAGRAAAASASRARAATMDEPTLPRGTATAADIAALRSQLQREMWTALGVIRDGVRIRGGIVYVERLRDEIARTVPAEPEALRDWVELGFLRDVAALSLTAALAREESRGAHYREDHPAEDPSWQRVIALHLASDGAATWSSHPVDAALAHSA